MARRSTRGARSRGPKNNVWTAVHVTNTAQSSTSIEAGIVLASDWTNVGGFERATLLTIRGYISVSPNVVDVSTGSFMALIYIADKGATAVDPQVVTAYTEDDILWTWGAQSGGQGAAAIEARPTMTEVINVKSMRRISGQQEVRVAVNASVGLDWRWTGMFRALLRRGGN